VSVRRVRAVVVAWNNAGFIERCVSDLLATVWDGQLEVVVVDNGSVDGTADLVADRFGSAVRIIRNRDNLGFAGGNNVALRDLEGLDAVALVNSDAFVSAVSTQWLGPLVAALEADDQVGAACPKIVFDPTFTECTLDSPVHTPGGADRRVLGQRVVGVSVDGVSVDGVSVDGVSVDGVGVDGVDQWGRCIFASGWSWPEPHARWTTGRAQLWAPVTRDSREVTVLVEGRPVPLVFDVNERFDVINNVGVELDERWFGRDRGFRQVDRGQFDVAEDVWGWCGAAVLLRADYLRQVGVFDERLFAYYEDVDLSWRGRKARWRYRYEPASVVRHGHAASSGEGSVFFDHLNHRNRLVVVSRHAPWSARASVWAGAGAEIVRTSVSEVVRPVLHGRRPQLNFTPRRVRSAGAAAAMLAPRRVKRDR
jgi:GT2 family glycosyltransferase